MSAFARPHVNACARVLRRFLTHTQPRHERRGWFAHRKQCCSWCISKGERIV